MKRATSTTTAQVPAEPGSLKEQAGRETRLRFEAVLDHIAEGIILFDRKTRSFSFNPCALRILGLGAFVRQPFTLASWSALFEVSTLEGLPITGELLPWARALRGESPRGIELRLRRADQEWERACSISCFTVRYGSGRSLAFMTIIDISERLAATRTLLASEAHLRHANEATTRAETSDRLKSEFLTTASHELRTPLTSIIGFVALLLQGLPGPLNAEQTRQLGIVRASARHLLALINDVLDLASIEAGQFEVRTEPFDLRTMLEHLIATVEPLATEKGLRLTLVADAKLGSLLSDRRRVEQVLLNLLNNAVKFTERGAVTLTVEAVGAPEPQLRLRVADTGIGITAVDLESLFQPFRQIDADIGRRREGTGLGLAISRRLAQHLRGSIQAASARGVGSSFTFTLPLLRPAPASSAAP